MKMTVTFVNAKVSEIKNHRCTNMKIMNDYG